MPFSRFIAPKARRKTHETAWRLQGADCRARLGRGLAICFLIAKEYKKDETELRVPPRPFYVMMLELVWST